MTANDTKLKYKYLTYFTWQNGRQILVNSNKLLNAEFGEVNSNSFNYLIRSIRFIEHNDAL